MADALGTTRAVRWGEFLVLVPELARFGGECLTAMPAYLATIRRSGAPRVHPVTPIFASEGLFLFIEPASPKGRDLRERRLYALHNGVPDNAGTGGEFYVSGVAFAVEEPVIRAEVVAAASYPAADRYVLFELLVSSARANGYGDVELPDPARWMAS